MTKLRTHYVELQVVEDASPEAIKGAYKHLAQKWHPDKHPHRRAEAEEISSRLNVAYDVLIDPAKRRKHDLWIAEQREKEIDVPPGTSTGSASRKSPVFDPDVLRTAPAWKPSAPSAPAPASPPFRQAPSEKVVAAADREKWVRFLSWWDSGNSLTADIFFTFLVAFVVHVGFENRGTKVSFWWLAAAALAFCYVKNRPIAKKARARFEDLDDRTLEARYIKVKHRLQLLGVGVGVSVFFFWWSA